MLQPRASNNLIRVAHVALQLQTGGMEKLLVEFARHADRRRFDLRFLSLGGRGSVADEIEACGWPITALETPPGLRPGLLFRLAGLFRRWGTEVVHTHNTKPLLYAAPAARLVGVERVIHTRHGQRYKAGRSETALFRLATGLTDRVVCVSHDSARLSTEEGVAARKVATVWNGIDVSRFAYAGPRPNGPAVTVGRLSHEKDVANLVRATQFAVQMAPGFRLQIAGDGPCRSELEHLADQLGVRDSIEFLGEVRDVAGLLARARLFVLPSLTEGVSLTLLEAMARGLPVVATDVGGNPEVVLPGETGLLVPAANPVELAGAVMRLWNDPERSRVLGEAGRRRVEAFFDVRRMVADYEALYRNDGVAASVGAVPAKPPGDGAAGTSPPQAILPIPASGSS